MGSETIDLPHRINETSKASLEKAFENFGNWGTQYQLIARPGRGRPNGYLFYLAGVEVEVLFQVVGQTVEGMLHLCVIIDPENLGTVY